MNIVLNNVSEDLAKKVLDAYFATEWIKPAQVAQITLELYEADLIRIKTEAPVTSTYMGQYSDYYQISTDSIL
jgi:hypothetical protein